MYYSTCSCYRCRGTATPAVLESTPARDEKPEMRPIAAQLLLLSSAMIGRAFVPSRCARCVVSQSRCYYRFCYPHSLSIKYNHLSASNHSAENDAATGADNCHANDSARRQHIIRWRSTGDDVTFTANDGELLRTAALRRGLVSPHNGRARLINCRGLGTCGTCAVEIESPLEEGNDSASAPLAPVDPPERNNVENVRLNFPPHNFSSKQSPNLRLACQVAVRGDLVVTKRAGFWGQNDEQKVGPSSAKTYFGEMEYIFDGRSPPADDQE